MVAIIYGKPVKLLYFLRKSAKKPVTATLKNPGGEVGNPAK
jgi:hypothetical protein